MSGQVHAHTRVEQRTQVFIRRHVIAGPPRRQPMVRLLQNAVVGNPNACSDASPRLDTGDTAWQLTAATFVGLMSIPALAVLYAGLVPKKWVVNTMFMAFTGFSGVLVVWVLWGYKMGFGTPIGGGTTNTLELQVRGQLLLELLQQLRRPPRDLDQRGSSQIMPATLYRQRRAPRCR